MSKRRHFTRIVGFIAKRNSGILFSKTNNPQLARPFGSGAFLSRSRTESTDVDVNENLGAGPSQARLSQAVRQADAVGSPPVSNKYGRISKAVFDLAKHPNSGSLLPARLRPKKDTDLFDEKPNAEHEQIQGNVIANLALLEDHYNEAIVEHLSQHLLCRGKIVAKPRHFIKFGWVFSAVLSCTLCEYKTELYKFYEEEEDEMAHGRRAARVNKQMTIGITKHPIGVTSMREILASCDIAPPTYEASGRWATMSPISLSTQIENNWRRKGESLKKLLPPEQDTSMGC